MTGSQSRHSDYYMQDRLPRHSLCDGLVSVQCI